MHVLRIAITGTHGNGKTTLARALSAKTGLPLIAEQARIVATEMGLTDCSRLLRDPELARTFQERVLEGQIAAQVKHPEGFIADRSTLDAIAYWKLYLNGSQENIHRETNRYIFKARLHAWKGLDLLVYVPPLNPPGGDGFRLTTHHIEADALIRRELRLLRESGRMPVVVLRGRTLENRLTEIELAIQQDTPEFIRGMTNSG
ncbi:MAG: hypothetical protein C4575_13685 [Desulforudis sp.]|nr:MAG: hypothetical protein C4575_13685 [Desulforudis sp.]